MTEESVINDIKDLKSKDIDLKWSAINNLRIYLQSHPPTDFRSRMIIKSLLGLSKDSEPSIRETVLLSLIEAIPEVSKIEPLILRAFSDPSSGIRSIALEWMNNQNHPQLRDYTVKSLQDQGEVVRKTALDIVISRQIEGVERELLKLLKTEKGGLRRSVIYALGKLKTPQAINTLIEIMRNPEYDDWTRNQASSALDHMGGSEIIIPFIENLADPNDYVRETAASFLKKNENQLISKILTSRRLDYIALLHHATESTKQDFETAINTLKNQMRHTIEDLQSKLIEKDRIIFSELVNELQSADTAVKVLLTKILNLKLIQISDDEFLTETGLKDSLVKKLEENESIHIPTLQKTSPFLKVDSESLREIIISIPFSKELDRNLFLTNTMYSEILNEFENTGVLNLPDIAERIRQPLEIINEIVVPSMNSTKTGWINARGEYLTEQYLKRQISKQIDDHEIISLNRFLEQIGNPKIKFQKLKELINALYKGKWLEQINVFLKMSKFQELEKTASGIDESRVEDLLSAIGMSFSTFLKNLQTIMEIKTFKAKNGQLVSLDSLHTPLQQKIIGNGYIVLTEFLKSMKLDKDIASRKPTIMEYITQEFSGRTDPEGEFFATEDLISTVVEEIKTKTRLNFSVIGFKLNLDPKILSNIIRKILFIRGFTNKIGEFVTQDGIYKEIAGIMEYREEFSFQELFEILDITENKDNILLVRDLIAEDENLLTSQDNKMVMSQKMAMNKILSFVKNPTQQMKEKISIEEISLKTNISSVNTKNILNSLIQNNLINGSMKKNAYKP
ncbi:MAG: HEAT repeat domain-containing protein [Candidatus Hodarchaeota archaeon]